MRHRLLAPFCAILLLASAARADTIADPVNHFTLNLPAGWHVMSRFELSTVNGPSGSDFVGGARWGQGPLPYILLKPMGRPPSGSSSNVEEFRKALTSEGIEVSEASYDTKRNAFIAKFNLQTSAGRVSCMCYVFAGSEKGITLYCYSRPAQMAEATPKFEALADAFHFDEGYGYSSFPFRIGTAVLVGAIVGAGTWMLKRMFRTG